LVFGRDVNLSNELTKEHGGVTKKIETDRLRDDENSDICVQGRKFVFFRIKEIFISSCFTICIGVT
jgi:hypothetical protein